MSDLNSVAVIGRLTKDAVLKTLPTGTKLLEFSLANNTGFGQYAKTNFFEVKMWGKGAEGIAKYLIKGSQIGVAGTLENEAWVGKDGSKHDKWVISTNNVSLLGSKSMDVTSAPSPSDDEDFNKKYAKTVPTYAPIPTATGFAEDAELVAF